MAAVGAMERSSSSAMKRALLVSAAVWRSVHSAAVQMPVEPSCRYCGFGVLGWVVAYPLTRRSEGPVPLRGKVIRIVRAAGRTAKDVASSVVGSKLKGVVPSRPEVEVATKLMDCWVRRGRRKVDVQPAPRMRRSTGGWGFGHCEGYEGGD